MSNSNATSNGSSPNQIKKANQRGAARLAAVQALYQMDVGRTSLDATLAQFMGFYLGKEVEGDEYLPADEHYFKMIVSGVSKHQLQIDPLVDESLVEGRPVTRIDSILRAILRAGAMELLHKKDVPPKVIITEYVDIARAFFAEDEPRIVNAVLDKIARKARVDELE